MQIKPGYKMRKVAGEYVIIPTGEAAQDFYGLISVNEVGALLWQTLERPCTTQDLVEAVLREYEVNRETAAQDVADFIQNLENNHLLLPE